MCTDNNLNLSFHHSGRRPLNYSLPLFYLRGRWLQLESSQDTYSKVHKWEQAKLAGCSHTGDVTRCMTSRVHTSCWGHRKETRAVQQLGPWCCELKVVGPWFSVIILINPEIWIFLKCIMLKWASVKVQKGGWSEGVNHPLPTQWLLDFLSRCSQSHTHTKEDVSGSRRKLSVHRWKWLLREHLGLFSWRPPVKIHCPKGHSSWHSPSQRAEKTWSEDTSAPFISTRTRLLFSSLIRNGSFFNLCMN